MNAELQLQRLLATPEHAPKDQQKFRIWFEQQFRKDGCNLEDFALYYLHTMRQCTELHLRGSESGTDTPKCQTPVRTLKAPPAHVELTATTMSAETSSTDTSLLRNNSSYTPKRLILTNSNSTPMTPSFNQSQDLASLQMSTDKQQKSQHNTSASSFNCSYTQAAQSNYQSTPLKRTPNQQQPQGRRSNQNLTGLSSTSTPQSVERKDRNVSTGLCLGDFLLNTPTQGHKKKKGTTHADTSGGAGGGAGGSASNAKPKKRVVPTTISKNVSASAFGSALTSAFSNENNLLRLSSSAEIVDPNQCAVLEARKSLKLHADEISKELSNNQTAAVAGTLTTTTENARELTDGTILMTVDLTKVTQQSTLDVLAAIYVQLIDLNLVPNVLSELAFVLQLLNVSETNASVGEVLQTTMATTSPALLTLLCEFNNCMYFAVRVLDKQRQLLMQLDLKSLGVVLNNERIALLPKGLQTELEITYQTKQKLTNQPIQQQESLLHGTGGSFKNVYYQHDKDSREHFPTQNEFGAFKMQRDLFYKTYKHWESNHLNPNFRFNKELTVKVRDIFRQSEHPVNMAHFAKLFVAQLLISACDATTSPQDLGIEMDMQKFSKLTQRLFAPSNFSVEYQFPRSQAFFRDFIAECGSYAFLVQLKLALYAQLSEFNDSTFEHLELHSAGNRTLMDEDETAAQKLQHSVYVVRPQVLAALLILAKFLGYVTALPYVSSVQQDEATATQQIIQQQLHLRRQFQPDFDICALLQTAMHGGKLLITLPWLVQYLAMLDDITLLLENYTATLHLLFELYSRIGQRSTTKLQLQPAAVFIIRCCIGWLLETKSSVLIAQYYDYRALRQTNYDIDQLITLTVACLQLDKKTAGNSTTLELDNTLEQLLNVACPFLPEFRVSIMPARYALTKCASRTGRYRHITTRFAVLSTPNSSSSSPASANTEIVNIGSVNGSTTSLMTTQQAEQNKLIEAFLHSQHTSMRRLIEFVSERTYKSVIKDGQLEILLPSKADADNKVNQLTSNKRNVVFNAVRDIYAEAREAAHKEWQTRVPDMIDKRIRQSLDTLLPANTNEVIKRTYAQLIERNASQQIQNWLQMNLLRANFYCQDLQDMTQKICKANKAPQQTNSSTELRIEPSATCVVSDLMDDLKYWLHVTSMRPELVTNATRIEDFIETISDAFVHTLPTVFYRLVGVGLVQLCQHLIVNHTMFLTQRLIDNACRIWTYPELRELAENIKTADMSIPGIFDSLITVCFIQSLGTQHERFVALQQLLVAMIATSVISVDFVNVFFMQLFKENWESAVWTELSQLLEHVAQEAQALVADTCTIAPEDDAKSQLLMEVLADFSRDLDF